MSYGADFAIWPARVRYTSTRFSKGAKPADLSVAFTTKFELIINLKAAMAIGLDMFAVLLARADEVIE